MKYKTMYGLHETRMWIGTIIAGVAAVAAIVEAHPEVKEKAKAKWEQAKAKFKKKPKEEKIKLVVVDENGNPL